MIVQVAGAVCVDGAPASVVGCHAATLNHGDQVGFSPPVIRVHVGCEIGGITFFCSRHDFRDESGNLIGDVWCRQDGTGAEDKNKDYDLIFHSLDRTFGGMLPSFARLACPPLFDSLFATAHNRKLCEVHQQGCDCIS
jgi:hypothetical protein